MSDEKRSIFERFFIDATSTPNKVRTNIIRVQVVYARSTCVNSSLFHALSLKRNEDKNMKKCMIIIICLLLILSGCTKTTKTLILATTTSTEQTGLLETILPDFTQKTGIEVKVIAVGTGQALEMGKNGEADVLLVHSKAAEEDFISDGYGMQRFDVMYNDFVMVGPEADPLEINKQYKSDIQNAFKELQNGIFISRGDDSGTHKKELTIWKKIGVEPSGDWYISAGKGMGEVLQMANEKKAYTLTDRGTYLSMSKDLDLVICVEKDPSLLNQYGVIAVNPAKNPSVHVDLANAFIEWIKSDETQIKIGEFGVKEYGEPLFVPNAKK